MANSPLTQRDEPSSRALVACLNGSRSPTEHPGVPCSPVQIAADAAACRAAGATAVHVHVRDGRGLEVLTAEHVDEVLDVVRSACPGLPIGLTTGAWILPDPAERIAAVASWRSRPDYASVNWHEPGAELVAAALLERGVGVEAGLWNDRSVARWARWPQRGQSTRVLLELPGGLDVAEVYECAITMLRSVVEHAPGVQVQLHGGDDTAWPALECAAALGVEARIGLEDVVAGPDGAPAASNAELVAAAVARLRRHGAGPRC